MQIVPSASGTPYEYTLAPLPDHLIGGLSNEESARLVKIHGAVPEPFTKTCHTCRREGFFKTRLADGTVVTCECRCRDQWLLGRHLLRAGIGDTYQRYSWQHVRGVPPEVAAQVADYVARFDDYYDNGVGLVLWSERTGTGKSLLTYLAIKEALAREYQVYFTSFTEMIDHHTASWSDKEHRAWFARHIQNIPVLGIDDIGKENPGRANVVDELLDRVIRSRIAHGRVTFLNSNLNPVHTGEPGKDFSRYQAGLLDLLAERSLVIEVTGPGYRSRKAQELVTDVREGIRYPVVIR